MSKYIDIKPEPKTNLEAFKRWQNHTTSRLVSAMGQRIPVMGPDLVVSKSGCVIDSYGRVRHTETCSCDDEVDEVRQNV